jgi:hypothetical protein
MSFSVPPGPLATVYRLEDYATDLPSDPVVDPSQVWGEVMAAAQLFGTLRDAGLSVRFDAADPGQAPRVLITDLQGRMVREVSPAVACDPEAMRTELLAPPAA